ncbi:C-terminal domain of CHU protein family protein [Mariniphaga anaerophila]|uniref:C-terminal domain of CHU protein family protein n=1 Tax=Mariniphaga anaerophila TaxID=1484053 RepID=A0A1M4YQZ5_9BACT|nr:gliding motility-associated C-terminal domain-containing protein [Mariniphaga anaerophila]SHF08269.1 C-terminal domain of CHU protein family protein [Mariniphaga anaerophila]
MACYIQKFLTIILLCCFTPIGAQEVWKESFSVSGKGIWGDGNGGIDADFAGITSWFLEYFGLHLTDSGDYAKTAATSGGRFEVCDIDGEITWRSAWIDISNFEKVNIELTAAETGSGDNTETKYLKAFYRIDGGTETPFSENSINSGNWGQGIAAAKSLAGDSLQIVCYIANHYSADKVILDEVVVAAEEKYYPPAEPGELLVSEVLFNPFPDGDDYVEIYNNSEREIPIGKLFLASRDKELQLAQISGLSGKIYLFPPKSYVAVTKDTAGVFPFFPIKCSECFQQVSKLPSFNNDRDHVVLLNENLEILDELYYSEEMHSPFLANNEGISLERISFSVPTNTWENWHSASSDAGYGTPGYENSQAGKKLSKEPAVTFSPKAFSPNSDGFNDEFVIGYQLPAPGYVANIKIFDAAGRYVMSLAKNAMLGTNGEFVWNGEDETGSRQPLGAYIIMVELFNTTGDVFRFKEGVVLTDILK